MSSIQVGYMSSYHVGLCRIPEVYMNTTIKSGPTATILSPWLNATYNSENYTLEFVCTNNCNNTSNYTSVYNDVLQLPLDECFIVFLLYHTDNACYGNYLCPLQENDKQPVTNLARKYDTLNKQILEPVLFS